MNLSKLTLFMALLSPVLLTPAYAQRGGGHGGGGGHVGGGGHSGGAVGGGFSGGGNRGGVTHGGGVVRGGVSRGYYYGDRYYSPGFAFGVGAWGYPYYGYYNPYYGYYGYDPYGYDGYPAYSAPPAQQDYGYTYPPQVQGQPPQPPIQQTQPQAQPQAQLGASNGQTQSYWLIAFNDHTIEAATMYKVEGDQIHWITLQGQEKQAPLSKLDVPMSQKLNRDRQGDFQIP